MVNFQLQILIIWIVSNVAAMRTVDTIGRERPRRVFKYRGTAYATPHSKPWSAVLLREKEYDGKRTACGAFLINRPPNEHDYVENGSSDLLLTAAHCLMDMVATQKKGKQILFHPRTLTVLLGKHDTWHHETTEQRYRVINTIVHEKHLSMNDSKYDIGMIKLHEAVAFNSYIRAIPLTNSTIDHVNDCALSGWGSSYTGDSGKWGPKSTLTTAIFPDIAFEDDELRHYEVLRSPVTHGDSGSALECRLMNQSIVQGIAKGKDMQRGRRFIIFSDINYLSEWIKLSFTKIDHHSQLAIYHWQLERYKNYEGSDLGAIDLEEQIRVQTGYILAKNFQREIFLNKSSEVHISKLWFTLNVDFHTDVFHNRFNLQGMRGYSVEYDVYNCAMLCYINNMNGSCSYAAHSKRCYYSDSVSEQNTLLLKIDGCVHILFGHDFVDKDPYEELQKMGHKITSYNSIGKRTHLNELMWNVSVNIKYSDNHCEAILTSSKGSMYDFVELSTSCYEYFKDILEHKQSQNVYIDALFWTHNSSYHSKAELTNEPGSRLKLHDSIPIPVGFGLKHGYATSKLASRDYEPSNGAFFPGAFAAPFVVFIFNDEDYRMCIGALIPPEIPLAFSSSTREYVNALLTSNECAKGLTMTNAKISVGFTSYGSNVYEQKRTALMVESHKSGISVVSLFRKIYLNYFVQSILLPSNHVASRYLTFSIVAMARESQDEMKIPQLLKIPVKIHNYTKLDGVEKVLTERLYAHANWPKTLSNVRVWGMLVAYDQIGGQHILFGIDTKFAGLVQSKLLDEHTLIEPNLEWLRGKIK